MIALHFKDNVFPFKGVSHVRNVARGIVINEKRQIAMHVIKRNDDFGDVTYLETPGGGVDEGEDYASAFIRECEEEIGYRVEIVCEIGHVTDFYNLIARQNENHFFLARIKSKTKKHFVSEGDSLIVSTIWKDIDEIIEMEESASEEMVAGLVKQRELPILLEAKRLLSSQK